MRPTLRLVHDGESAAALSCIRCRLRIAYGDRQAMIVSDLLATHWADDHHLPGWRDPAAKARDRLWRRHPELLDDLAHLSLGNTHGRTG
jgi:hypothetical protein